MNLANADFRLLPKLYESKGFTQTAFAKELGIQQPYLSEVVNNKKLVSLGLFFRMAQLLEMRPSQVMHALEQPIASSA